MPSTDEDRLRHMLEAARDATDFVTGKTRADLDRDRMLRRALIQCIQVIGEAASQLAPETRASRSDIPWREIRRMRNILVHVYFGINLDILWRTIVDDLPQLIGVLERTLGEAQSGQAI